MIVYLNLDGNPYNEQPFDVSDIEDMILELRSTIRDLTKKLETAERELALYKPQPSTSISSTSIPQWPKVDPAG